MSHIVFINTVTHVPAHWANDVDTLVYAIFDGAQNKEEARIALGVDMSNIDITGGRINNTTIGIDTPSTAHFHWALIDELPISPEHAANKRYVDMRIDEVSGGGGGGPDTNDGFLTQDITTLGTTVGAADEGVTFPTGMTFTEFVERISRRLIHPTYVPATVDLLANFHYTDRLGEDTVVVGGSQALEVGTILLTLQVAATFNQNDAGGLAAGTPGSYHLFIDGVANATAPQNAPSFTNVSILATRTWRITVDHLQGPIKNNNFGTPDPVGRISAGTTIPAPDFQLFAVRLAFYGTPTTTPSVSTDVRTLAHDTRFDLSFPIPENPDVDDNGGNLNNPQTPSFTITIPSGSTRVSFAYPATLRDVASVRYQELADSEIKGNFTLQVINVEGANGFTAIPYKVYTYVPVEPFSQQVHYKVFI